MLCKKLCLIVLLLTASLEAKRCLLHMGKCLAHCPRHMHPYHTRCDVSAHAQATCAAPREVDIGFTCGWSRCDCNGQLVLDENNGECVELAECSAGGAARRRPALRGFPVPKDLQLHTDGALDTVDLISHDPVYTGHCPLLKFRYGRCYGDDTRQILREIRSSGLFSKPVDCPPLATRPAPPPPPPPAPLYNRAPAYTTGYTGYVPGMFSCYGKSYGRAADDCLSSLAARRSRSRSQRSQSQLSRDFARSQSAPRVETVRSRDEVRRDLHRFREINKYKENTITPEFPPIAGYTGHIPRIKGAEASLSQRYRAAAGAGLRELRRELARRDELPAAEASVRAALREHERRRSYLNWG